MNILFASSMRSRNGHAAFSEATMSYAFFFCPYLMCRRDLVDFHRIRDNFSVLIPSAQLRFEVRLRSSGLWLLQDVFPDGAFSSYLRRWTWFVFLLTLPQTNSIVFVLAFEVNDSSFAWKLSVRCFIMRSHKNFLR